jgi:hypothetical protein
MPLCPSSEIMDVAKLSKESRDCNGEYTSKFSEADEKQVHELIEIYGHVFRSIMKSLVSTDAAQAELDELDRDLSIVAGQIALYGVPMEGDRDTHQFPNRVIHVDRDGRLKFASAKVVQSALTRAAKLDHDKVSALLKGDRIIQYLGDAWEVEARRLLLVSEEFECSKMVEDPDPNLKKLWFMAPSKSTDKTTSIFKLPEGSTHVRFNTNQLHQLGSLGSTERSLFTPVAGFPSGDDLTVHGWLQTTASSEKTLNLQTPLGRGSNAKKALAEMAKAWWNLQTDVRKSALRQQNSVEVPIYYVVIPQRAAQFRVDAMQKSLIIHNPNDPDDIPPLTIVPYIITPKKDPWIVELALLP